MEQPTRDRPSGRELEEVAKHPPSPPWSHLLASTGSSTSSSWTTVSQPACVADAGIERLSKLPPGFSHELPAHLAHAHKDDLTGLPITAFEDFCCGAHGLSILIVSTLNVMDPERRRTAPSAPPASLAGAARNVYGLIFRSSPGCGSGDGRPPCAPLTADDNGRGPHPPGAVRRGARGTEHRSECAEHAH